MAEVKPTATCELYSRNEDDLTGTDKYSLKSPSWFLQNNIYLQEEYSKFRPQVRLRDEISDKNDPKVRQHDDEQPQGSISIPQDIYEEVGDLLGNLQNPGLARPKIVFVTKHAGCEYVARALLAKHAGECGADLMTLDLVSLQGIAADFHTQLASQGTYEAQPDEPEVHTGAEQSSPSKNNRVLDGYVPKLWASTDPTRSMRPSDGGGYTPKLLVSNDADVAQDTADAKPKDKKLKADRPREDLSDPYTAFFYVPEVHLQDNEDKSARLPEAKRRQRAAAQAILASAQHKRSSTQSDSACRPLLVLMEHVDQFIDHGLHGGIVDMLLDERDDGRSVIFCITTTKKSFEDLGSRRRWYDVNISRWKAAASPVVRLFDDFPRDLHAQRLAYLYKIASAVGDIADLREQFPSNADLEALASCKLSLRDGTTFGSIIKQLRGRHARRGTLAFPDVLEISQRATRHKTAAEQNLKSGDEPVSDADDADDSDDDDKNKYEKQLLSCKVSADQIEETFDDIIIDDDVMVALRRRLRLALLPAAKTASKLLRQMQTPGILLHGPPGTGKTQLVRAIANSRKCPMLAIEGADMHNMYVGETEKMIRAAFSLARRLHPCILFLDEADALFFKRTSEDKSWQRSALNQFLAEMDGLARSKNQPLVIVATNRLQDMDPAFLRRLPHKVAFQLPKKSAREKIFRLHLKGIELGPDVDVGKLAALTEHMSGSDIRNLCSSALLESIADTNIDDESSGQGDVEIKLTNADFMRALKNSSTSSRTGGAANKPVFDDIAPKPTKSVKNSRPSAAIADKPPTNGQHAAQSSQAVETEGLSNELTLPLPVPAQGISSRTASSAVKSDELRTQMDATVLTERGTTIGDSYENAASSSSRLPDPQDSSQALSSALALPGSDPDSLGGANVCATEHSSEETVAQRAARIRETLAQRAHGSRDDLDAFNNLDMLAEASAKMSKHLDAELRQLTPDMPLLYPSVPNLPSGPNEQGSNSMTFKYEPIDHETHFRIFRLSYTGDDQAMVEGTLQTCSYDDHPVFGYIMNSAAFSNDEVSWIHVNGEPFPVAKGFEYFLRCFRASTRTKEDVLIFALVLSLDAAEPKTAMERLLKKGQRCLDAVALVNGLSDKTLRELDEHRDPNADQTVKLPHERQLDAGGWAGKYNPVHLPLDRTVNEIRLLSIQIYDGEPYFFTYYTSLAETGIYVALSYTWGEGTNIININGNDVDVSQNLHDFLMQAIEKGRELEREELIFSKFQIYWIDAICINQKDEQEKVYQIKNMHNIYSKAVGVIAWIGPGDLELFQQMRAKMDTYDFSKDDLAHKVRFNMPLEWDYQLCEMLMNTYARPYFTRAWTTQELVSAKQVAIQCGSHYLPMDYIAVVSPAQLEMPAFMRIFEKHPAAYEDKLSFIRGITMARPGFINRYKSRRAHRKKITLLSLLLATLNMRCREAKDKIYSLWSVADDAPELLGGEVDYSQPEACLFVQLMVGWMEKYQRMDILAIRSIGFNGSPINDCPTWAVDWHDFDRLTRPFLSSFPLETRQDALDEPEDGRFYDASKGIDHQVSIVFNHPKSHSSEKSPSLITAAISCDTIAYVTEPHYALQIQEDWLDFADRLDEARPHFIEKTDLYAALVAGRTPEGKKVEEFEDLRKYFVHVEMPNPQEYYDALTTSADWQEMESRVVNQKQYYGNIAWRQHMQNNAFGRRLALTKAGHIGLVPETSVVGDEIAIVFNCSIPLVFQAEPMSGVRILRGDAYFHRMMHGEVVEAAGGREKCLLDMYKCVEDVREWNSLRAVLKVEKEEPEDGEAAHEVDDTSGGRLVEDVAAQEDRLGSQDIRDNAAESAATETQANDAKDNEASSTSTAAAPEDKSPGYRTYPEMPDDLWCEQVRGELVDALAATGRVRQTHDEGVWVQLLHLPGMPDSEGLRSFVRRRAEERFQGKQRAAKKSMQQEGE